MRSRSILVLAFGWLVVATDEAALAAPAAPPAPPAPVSELVVVGGPPPKLVGTFPMEGTQVAAGVLVIKLTFDQAMTADGWSYGGSEGGDLPTCLARPRLLADKHTFVLLCTVAPRKTYAMAIGAAASLASVEGRAAKPSVLRFSTTDTTVLAMHEALQQANLTDADEPIMSWRDEDTALAKAPSRPAPASGAPPHP